MNLFPYYVIQLALIIQIEFLMISKLLITKQPTSPTNMDYEIFTFECKDLLAYELSFESPPYDFSTLKVNELEETFLGGYATPDPVHFKQYTVQPEDTIYGLELKFNISQAHLLGINQISEAMIFPGMIIKLPIELKNVLEQGEGEEVDMAVMERSQLKRSSGSFIGVNLMDEIQSLSQSRKLTVHYLTDSGSIEGILTVNEDMLFFDPFEKHEQEQNQQQKRYQASINLRDLHQAQVVELPAHLNVDGQYTKDVLIQLLLSAIGKRSFEDKYKQKLEKMKREGVPLASIYLRIQGQELNWLEKMSQANDIAEQINRLIARLPVTELATSLPYFDLTQSTESIIEKTKRILGTSCIVPRLGTQSRTIQHDQFVSIVANLPSVFRFDRDWNLLFSTHRHGSSMQTLLRMVHEVSPLILVIKDLDGWVFGAYLSDKLQVKNSFYGSGESFVFTFHDSSEIKVFRWSRQNNDFILCDNDGIAIGCGDKYAIYINRDMTGGYTSVCTTFENNLLSKQGPYEIDTFEIWGINYS